MQPKTVLNTCNKNEQRLEVQCGIWQPKQRYYTNVFPNSNQWRFGGLHFGGASGVAIIAAGGTDLYCHSEPPLASGKLCFIINFIGGQRGQNFYWWGRPPFPPFEPPLILIQIHDFVLVTLLCTNQVSERQNDHQRPLVLSHWTCQTLSDRTYIRTMTIVAVQLSYEDVMWNRNYFV